MTQVEQATNQWSMRIKQPAVQDWSGEFDVPHALAPLRGGQKLHLTGGASGSPLGKLWWLVTLARPVFQWTEDALTEQPGDHRLQASRVQRFCLTNLPT